MSTYTIGEIADRSGFTASALRYYGGIGLVPPSERTDAGYRLYDDHTLTRLAFIARAKQLGCSLGEITDLVAVWDGDRCGPTQRRFHELITAKITEAEGKVRELIALTDQLRVAAARLAGPASDGPCDDTCACVGAEPAAAGTVAVPLVAKPTTPPIACTLDGSDIADRLADWKTLLATASARTAIPDGVRIDFSDRRQLDDVARLVAAEQECCAFFAFTITLDHTGLSLDVRAPDGAQTMIDSLLGVPA